MANDRVTYARVISNGDGGITADIEGVVYSGVPSTNPDLQFGDQEPVGFLLPKSSRQPLIIARRSTVLEFPPLSSRIPPFAEGLWPQSRGGPRLSMVSQESQVAPNTSGGSYFFYTLSPINPSFPPLALCCPEISGQLRCAIYWAKLDGSNIQMVLTLSDPLSGNTIWEVPVGDAFSPPTGLNALIGLRMGWMGFDQQYQRFWLVGWGGVSNTSTLYCIDASGNLLGFTVTSSPLVQGSIGAGAFIKGWHSRRAPTYRQSPDDSFIRCYFRSPAGAIAQRWAFDPQSILPGYQIATSSAGNPFASTANPEGSWPIDAQRRQILIWVSGSVKLGNSTDSMMIAEAIGASQIDDARTREHKASLIALDIDSGGIKWRRDWVYSASGYSVDTDSVSTEESLRSAVIGGTIGGIAVRTYYPVSVASWSSESVYRGLAPENSIAVHPIMGVMFPGCYISNPEAPTELHNPVYSDYEVPIVPWVGPAWGGGGVYDSPSVYGSFVGPKYSWFAPGHVCLCPLPINVFNHDEGPLFGWPLDTFTRPDDPSIARLDPVGGVLNIDSTGSIFGAHAHQSQSIVRGQNDGQAEWIGHTETFQEAVLPATQCGQWINARLHWDCYMLGKVEHNMVLRLWRTGPDGQNLGDVDVSQYFPRNNSSFTWAARANIWQIVVFADRGRVLLLRDYFDSHLDSGNLENRPYLAIEVRDRDDLATVHDLIPLLEPWADTYTDESNPDDPVLRRIWDQYSNTDTVSLGKGSVYQDGSWVLWRHLAYNRQEDQIYCNECLIEDFESGIAITRRLTPIGEFERPESADAIGTMSLANGRQVWAPSVNVSGAWPVMVRANS